MRTRGTRFLTTCGLLTAAIFALAIEAPPAAAHGAKPDYTAYCKMRFGDQATGGWSQRRNAYACTPNGNFVSFFPFAINLPEICDMQFKASGYHTHPGRQPGQGPLITCNGTKASDTPNTAVAGRARPDFDKFCRDRYANSTGAKHTRQQWACIIAGRDNPTSNRSIPVDEVCAEQFPGSRKALIGSDHSGAPRWFCAGGIAGKTAGAGKKTKGQQGGGVDRGVQASSAVQSIWARNKARHQKFCSGGRRVLQTATPVEQTAMRRDNKTLCPAVTSVGATSREYCKTLPTPSHCARWSKQLASVDCFCKVLDYKMLP